MKRCNMWTTTSQVEYGVVDFCMHNPLGTVTQHHDPWSISSFQFSGKINVLLIRCTSPKSLRLNLRTPKCFNCNLQRTTSHWESIQENTFSSRYFQRYLLVGGLVFSVMSLPLFNEFCELRRAPWRWANVWGDMTLASSKLEEDLMVFCRFCRNLWTFTYLATTHKDIW